MAKKITAAQIEMLKAVANTDMGATAHEFQGYRIGGFYGRAFRQATGDALMQAGLLEIHPYSRARRIVSAAGKAFLTRLP